MAGQVATLIIPQDIQWGECVDDTICRPSFSYDAVDEDLIKSAAAYLKGGEKTLLILGGGALRKKGLLAAARIKLKTGCDLMSDSYPSHTDIGAGLPALKRVPHFPEHAVQKLSQYQTIIRIGTKPIVSFFGYKDVNCQLLSKEQTVINLTPGHQDLQQTLSRLADHAGMAVVKDMAAPSSEIPTKKDLPQGKLTGGTICQVLSAMVPKNSIVVEEAITSGTAYSAIAATARPHSLLTLTGGSLGQGMPCAVGAAFACPDRTVISFNGDGAAMYTLQSLWMQARDKLNITTLICANRSYDILKLEYHRAGNTDPAQNTAAMMSLDNPSIDWVKMSESMGVPAESVTSAAQLAHALKTAMVSPGPHLIEMVM
jgi:acetolactate synthase-1/2/3 large subunit